MIKRKAKRKFALIILSVVLGVFLTIAQFNIPFTNYTYNGFANSIKLGIDLKGGVLAVYNVVAGDEGEADLNSEIEATIVRLQSLITEKGYTEATVVRQSSGTDTQIRIEVPDVDDPQEIFNLIGQPAKLEIRKTESLEGAPELTGDNIKNVFATYQDGEYGVSVEFDAEGAQTFFNLTSELSEQSDPNNKLYLYIGGVLFSAPTVQTTISDGKTFISGNMSTYAEAEAYATKILSGTFSVELELSENSVVSATLGKDALSSGLIAGAIGLLLVFLFMFLSYGVFGLIANLSLAIYAVILMFFLQAVPLVQLTLPGIAGIILSFGMAVDANVVIFERIKDEYRAGKKIPASVKAGFSKSVSAIVDGNITTIIASLVLYILGTGAIKGFAITLLIGILVSMFTGLIVTKKLTQLALPLNSVNPKPYKLQREESVNELR
jgi:protein-export SecD/SecF family membrane protein